MRHLLTVFRLGMLLFSLGYIVTAVHADELAERTLLDRKIADLFFKEDFKSLEGLADEFRSKKTRSESGVWLLTGFYYAFEAKPFRGGENESYWNALKEISGRWVGQFPKSPTPYIVHGTLLRNHGWGIRGGGYANTVRPEAWPIFYKKLSEAKQYLLEHKTVAARDPQWYDVMAAIATAEQWKADEFEKLVDEGLRKEPLYYQLYFTAVSYFMPKWGGSAAEIEKFANAAVQRTRELEGYSLYARIYWSVSQYSCCEHAFSKSKVVWANMKRGIQDVLARYPDQWNINNFAYFACQAGDRAETRRLIGMIRGQPIMQGWQNNPENFSRCSTWAAST